MFQMQKNVFRKEELKQLINKKIKAISLFFQILKR